MSCDNVRAYIGHIIAKMPISRSVDGKKKFRKYFNLI